MSKGSGETRIAAACRDCGKTYAARRRPDGQIRPIGSPSGCPCGSDDFVRVTAESGDSSTP